MKTIDPLSHGEHTHPVPEMSWYECTRHTFASLFVMNGGSLELLRSLLGHSSVTTTERYSHLRPDLFAEWAVMAMDVDLSQPTGDVVRISGDMSRMATTITTWRQRRQPKLAKLKRSAP